MPGSSILLLNPRHKRRRRRLSNPRRARRAHSRRSNPRRRRYARRSNPRRLHRVRSHFARSDRGRRYRVRAHMSNPRRIRRRRSNPRMLSGGNLMREYVVPAGVGAAGAVGLKIGWGYLSPHLPAAIQSGWGALGGQAAVVLAAGWGLGKALPRHRRGIALGVVGALTVIAYSAAVQLLSQYAPNLAGLHDYTDYTGNLGAYMGNGMIAAPAASPMHPVASAGMGLVSPAPALRGLNAYMRY